LAACAWMQTRRLAYRAVPNFAVSAEEPLMDGMRRLLTGKPPPADAEDRGARYQLVSWTYALKTRRDRFPLVHRSNNLIFRPYRRLTSSVIAARTMSPASRRLSASRHSFDQE
jgi:hypothetical protein